MSLNKKVKDLIGEILLNCAENNCKVILDPIEDLEGATGYFTSEDVEISVATGSQDWWEVLAHEYCHFCQWKEGSFMSGPAWKKCRYINPWVIQNNNREGEKVSQEDLEAAYSIIIECEDDCMKRTLNLLQSKGLVKSKRDVTDYIKRSNLYLYLLHLEMDLRKFKNEEKYWNSYKLFRFIPDKFCYDPANPQAFKVPTKVKDFIIESESK